MASMLVVVSFFIACVHLSSSQTVSLDPRGNVSVCPNETTTITCRTTNGAAVWSTNNNLNHVFNGATSDATDLGIFHLSLTGLRKEGTTVVEVNSTATTIVGFRLEDANTTLTCLTLIASSQPNTVPIMESVVLTTADPPEAPVVYSFTLLTQQQGGMNNSLILISWTMSDCAVQYVVTINSSDGSVYPNITTSDTNTTVTLPNGMEYCVTLVAVDGIGRRRPDSVPSCYAIPDTPTPSSTIVVEVPTSTNQPPLYPVSPSSLLVEHTSTTVTGTLSPTQSPVVMGGISLIAVVLPIVVTLIISVIVVAIVIAVLLFRRQKDSINLEDRPQSPKDVSMSSLSHSERDELNSENNVYSELPGVNATMSDQSLTRSPNLSAASITPHSSITTTSHSGSINPDQVSQSPTSEDTTALRDRSDQNQPLTSIECVFQVFYHQLKGFNNWKIIFTLFPKEHHDAAVNKFNHMKKYGRSHTVVLNLNQTDIIINISDNISDGWKKQHETLTMSTTAIKQYNGDGEPPHCEMIVKAAADDVTPSDLSFTASFNGLQDPLEVSIEAQTVTDCIAQVFYYPLSKTSINCWKVKIAFFPKKLWKHVVTRIFQDSNVSSLESHTGKLNFSGGKISISAKDPTGWNITMHKEVDTALMERYNGIGEPPFCEMILRAADDENTPSDLELPVTLIGVKSPNNTMTLKRAVVVTSECPHAPAVSSKASDMKCLCQVFYHKMNVSHWKATLAFFPGNKYDKVREFYQDANIGPTIEHVIFTSSWGFKSSTIELVTIDTKESSSQGWKVYSTIKKIDRRAVEQYTGTDKPPFIEVIIEPKSVETIPSDDLKQELTFTGITPDSVVIERASEKSKYCPSDSDDTSQSNDDTRSIFEEIDQNLAEK